MKKIKLTQGKYALVDDEDFEFLNQYRWHIAKSKHCCYAVMGFPGGNKESMHRLILRPKKEQQVDHINHNGLDNRRKNIRICTPSQNQTNKRAVKGKSSKYLGVSIYHYALKFTNKKGKTTVWRAIRWRAQVNIEKGKTKIIGKFKTEREAALAYNKAAKKYYGKFANINKVK